MHKNQVLLVEQV